MYIRVEKVCRTGRELLSFFPPHLAHQKSKSVKDLSLVCVEWLRIENSGCLSEGLYYCIEFNLISAQRLHKS